MVRIDLTAAARACSRRVRQALVECAWVASALLVGCTSSGGSSELGNGLSPSGSPPVSFSQPPDTTAGPGASTGPAAGAATATGAPGGGASGDEGPRDIDLQPSDAADEVVSSPMGTDEEYPLPEALPDEDGGELWLRYRQIPVPGRLAEYRAALSHVVSQSGSPTLDAAQRELVRGLSGLTGSEVTAARSVQGAGAVAMGTPQSSPLIAALPLAQHLETAGPEGYRVERVESGGQSVIAVAANSDVGVLYGSFALLRHLQTHSSLDGLALASAPKIRYRLLDHWDNLDRSVERGYAGRSLWDWAALPAALSPRYEDYARANASIGVNGAVLTNVNANAQVLTAAYLAKVRALADAFRPWGIAVYLTARFSAPIEIGGLGTADPLDPDVRRWWADKAAEIYALIPDFGGFLVKANSEGQPGPQDYGRSHADGANALADAVAPYGGIVMWRAFVYADGGASDRIREAYDEFQPLDGQFRDNVLIQPKNGPLDFQPREPFHPLFGAMPNTPLALELQITKEYLGQDTHLAYLGPLYQEVLRADTFARGPGSTVARVIDGTLEDHAKSAIAGVANVGDEENWTGSHFNQANWYVYGRMAWDPDLGARSIAEEWVRSTFSNDPLVVGPVASMMMSSRQTLVDYMTPLGLVHIMASGHHYGPGPWVSDLGRAEWNPVYYHRADAQGVGFDRTASGSNAVEQYFEPVRSAFASRSEVPDDFLLFFHHVGWGESMRSGRTLWDELVHRYSHGVDGVAAMRDAWATVAGRIDDQRFGEAADFLQIQHFEARWWRDACLEYFRQFSGRDVPSGYAQPANPLSFYEGLSCPNDVTKPRCQPVNVGTPSPAILP